MACEITFRNMLDSTAVLSVLMIILLHTKQMSQGSTKTVNRSTDGSRGRPLKMNDPTFAARSSANDKILAATWHIQDGMFCKQHNHLCYEKFDGTCGMYTNDYVLEHAKKLMCAPCTILLLMKTDATHLF